MSPEERKEILLSAIDKLERLLSDLHQNTAANASEARDRETLNEQITLLRRLLGRPHDS